VSADVFERNLRLLLRRSYVPALPAPAFRDRLEGLFLAEVARRARAERTRTGAGPARRVLPWAVAAAAALLAVLGWRAVARETRDPARRLLARGEVALGFPDGSWRAAQAGERAQGLAFAPPALAVLTPERVEFDVLAAGGRVHLGARSELALAASGDEVLATLRAGTAVFQRSGERLELVPGSAQLLRSPAAPTAAAGAAEGAAPRVALAPERAPEPPAAPAPRALQGTVVRAGDGTPCPSFSVALLAERRGYETPPPVVRAFTSPEGRFRWPDPPAGKQRVFVHAPGLALGALGEFDLSGELPALRAELAEGVLVRGLVLDADGNPVPNALVLSEHEAPSDGLLLSAPERAFWLPIRARSGPDGRFELAHLRPGTHTLRAGAAGFAPLWRDGIQVPRAPVDELVFELGRGGTVEGTVLREDGGPAAEAEVVLVGMDQGERPCVSFDYTHTGGDGSYRFEHVPAATMIVVTMRTPTTPEVRPILVTEGQTVRADFGSEPRGIRVHGRVLTADGGALAGQSLGLFDAESATWNEDWIATTTLADGSYSFEGVEPGRFQVFLIDELGRGLRCVDEFAVPAGAPEFAHEVRLSGAELAVTVFDARSAEPVPQAALMLMRREHGGRESFCGVGITDPEGRFVFVDQRPGTYEVYAYPTRVGLGFERSERVTLVGPGPGASAPAELEIGLSEGGAVVVLVRAPDGRALEGAVVVFHDEGGEEHTFSRLPMTDSAGRYRAVGLRPGSYRVSAHLDGYQGTPVAFRLDLARELEVPVLLAPVPPR
jgi:protocatechuate 3,4-dioxygenase beta subunit